jgi:hypothetical protein
MKRSFLTILSLALVAVLVLCTAACSNNESEKETDEAVLSPNANENVYESTTGSFEYALNDEGKCEITKYNPSSVAIVDVKLPETIDGRDIVGVSADAFKAENSIKSVTIPATYTYISDYAFYDCDALEAVTFEGENITDIGMGAFEGCDKLATINLPKSVVTVEPFAFKGCTSLVSVDLSGSLKTLSEGVFFGCSALKTVTLADSVEYVVKNAFYGCDALEYTTYENAEYIGNSANPHLVLVKAEDLNIDACKVNDSTKVIASQAFAGCKYLSSLTLGNSVTVISASCFEGCSELTYTESENGLYLGSEANPYMVLMGLAVPSVEDFTLNTATKILCDAAFNNCAALADIHFAGTVAEWEAIVKTDTWHNGRTVRVVFADETVEPIIYN